MYRGQAEITPLLVFHMVLRARDQGSDFRNLRWRQPEMTFAIRLQHVAESTFTMKTNMSQKN